MRKASHASESRRTAAEAPLLAAADSLNAESRAWVEQTMAGMGLERKVAQLVCSDLQGAYIGDGDPRIERWCALAREVGLGMFVVYGGTPRDVAHLLNRLQGEASVPLLVSADFEGGPGQQVAGAMELPANMAFSAAGSEDLMYRAASAAAVEGRAMGIHLTYTPVVDITWRPENPAEGVRTFGGDLDLLGRMVRAYVRGYHEHGMLTTAKHFPGRGDVEKMPEWPTWSWINKPASRVEAEEFAAFRKGIEAGVDFVMSEHIAVPSVTGGSDLPASVEGKLITGWLREKLGFGGLISSDDLWYDEVVERFGSEEVAVRAFEAGHDVLLKPRNPEATIAAMVEAVRSGRIREERVDGAVRKMLLLKARLGLHRSRLVDEAALASRVGTREHLELVQEVGDRSLTLLKNAGVFPVSPGRLAKAVNICVQKLDNDPSPPALAARLAAAASGMQSFFLRPELESASYERIWPSVAASELVILSLFVPRNRLGEAAPFRDADLRFVERVIAAKPGAVVAMSYGNPQLIRRIPGVAAFLVGYGEKGWFGNQAVYFDSFIRALQGKLRPVGRLPVRVNEQYGIGSGV